MTLYVLPENVRVARNPFNDLKVPFMIMTSFNFVTGRSLRLNGFTP